MAARPWLSISCTSLQPLALWVVGMRLTLETTYYVKKCFFFKKCFVTESKKLWRQEQNFDEHLFDVLLRTKKIFDENFCTKKFGAVWCSGTTKKKEEKNKDNNNNTINNNSSNSNNNKIILLLMIILMIVIIMIIVIKNNINSNNDSNSNGNSNKK